MIRTFKLTDNFRIPNQTDPTSFNPSYDTWKNKNNLKITGLARQDWVGEVDTNRPFKELINNDEILNNLLKAFLNKRLASGIYSGCSLVADSYNFNSSNTNITKANLDIRLNANKSIPFIIPTNISLPSNNIDYNTETTNTGYSITNGVIVGNSGEFYVVSPDVTAFREILLKVLALSIWVNDTFDLTYDPTLANRYMISAFRQANGLAGDTISDRTITNAAFDSLDYKTTGLCDLLGFSGGVPATQDFNHGITDLNDVLYARLENRFSFIKASTSGKFRWNFIILNETNNRLEHWFSGTNSDDANEYGKLAELATLATALTGQSYVLLYSVLLNYAGTVNNISPSGYQELGFTSFGTIPSAATYNIKINVNGTITSPTITIVGGDTWSSIVGKLNTAVPTAYFGILNNDIRCYSKTSGVGSYIRILQAASSDFFLAISNFSGFEVAVDGVAPSTFYTNETMKIKSISPITYSVVNYKERIALSGINIGDEVFEQDTGILYKWNGYNFVQT